MSSKKIIRRITLTLLVIITLFLLFFVTFNLSAQEITIKQTGDELYVKIDCRNLPEIILTFRILINDICVSGGAYLNDHNEPIFEIQRSYKDKGKVIVLLYTDGKNKLIARKEGYYK